MANIKFKEGTPQVVRNIIENEIKSRSRKRFRLWYGDDTGKSWNEENDICGHFGQSTGTEPIPLLIHNSRCMGGCGLLTHRIIKIVDTSNHNVLYKHPTFNQPKFIIDGLEVKADGKEHAKGFKTPQAAERYCAFMNGERMSK